MATHDELPPLPKSIAGGSHGPIKIKVVKDLKHSDGEECDGLWVPEERTLYLDKRNHRAAAWPLLMHEKVHAWLADIGVYEDDSIAPMKMHSATIETICNHFGGLLMNEMYARLRRGGKA